jgi:hypothetical protein
MIVVRIDNQNLSPFPANPYDKGVSDERNTPNALLSVSDRFLLETQSQTITGREIHENQASLLLF